MYNTCAMKKKNNVIKDEKLKKINKYLGIGATCAIISVIGFILSWTLTYVLDLSNLSKNWYIFIILGVSIILFLISFFILKKWNKKKLEYMNEKDKEEFNKKMEEYLKKKNENKK